MPINMIIDFTSHELAKNANEYFPFLINNYSLYNLMHNYFSCKKWDSDIGDIIPLAIANAFAIRIAVIRPQCIPQYVVIEPRDGSTDAPYIILHLYQNHFSSTSTSALPFAGPTLSSTSTSSQSFSAPTLSSPRVDHCQTATTIAPPRSHDNSTTTSTSAKSTLSTSSAAQIDSKIDSSTAATANSTSSLTSLASITHCNVQGLLGSTRSGDVSGTHRKLDILRELLSGTEKLSVFCVSETKLGSSIDDKELAIPDYVLYRADRNRRGGGVAIYCHHTLHPRLVQFNDIKIEHLCIKISTSNNKHLLICCIYRPPSETISWLDPFYALVNYIVSDSSPCIIVGDFNIDLHINKQFATNLESTFGLNQHIATSTRITSSSSTLIDHIYTAGLSNISTSVTELHIADHCAVSCNVQYRSTELNNNAQKHKYNTFRPMKNIDIDSLQSDLTSVQWSTLLSATSDINEMLQIFYDNLLAIWNKHAPITTRRIQRNHTPWMSNIVLNLIHKRDNAYNTFLRNRSKDGFCIYKTLRNACTSAIRRAKRDFFIEGARAGSRHFWRHVKSCTGLGKVKSRLMPWPCHNQSAAKCSANRINVSFVDSVTKLCSGCNPQLSQNTVTPALTESIFKFSNVSAADIQQVVHSLPSSAAEENDGVSVTMLKKCPHAVFKALQLIFNKSLSSGIFPNAWKHAIVVPVHKKGDIYSITNYRPISLLPAISKVFEKLVNVQLRDYLDSHAIISSSQHGFRSKHSCETALLQLTKNLFTLRAEKKYIYVTALDFSRAFDTINLNILNQRISSFADTTTASWFKSYAEDRMQSTKYANVISDPCQLHTGTPQGSILAPTLFSIYINNLLTTLKPDEVIAYADDVTIINADTSPGKARLLAEQTVAQINAWALANGLVLNIPKSQTMLITPHTRQKSSSTSSPATHLSIPLCNDVISSVDELRLLGITITNNLKWSSHSSNVRKSVNKMINVLNRFGVSLNLNSRNRIFNSFIAPKLSFCVPVWCWIDNTEIKAFDHTLKHAARVITHNKRATLNNETFNLTGLLPFKLLSQRKCLLTTQRLLCEPDSLIYMPTLIHHSSESQRSTRGSDGRKFLLPAHRCTSYEHCFYYMAAKIWNTLPCALTSLQCPSFRKSVTDYLLTQL